MNLLIYIIYVCKFGDTFMLSEIFGKFQVLCQFQPSLSEYKKSYSIFISSTT